MNENDFAGDLVSLIDARIERALKIPTGVTPGFHVQSGLTIGRYGHVLFAGSPNPAYANANLLAIATRGSASAVNIAAGAAVRLPFNTPLYDPLEIITLGTAAHITVPVESWYRIDVGIGVRGANGTYVRGDFFDVFIHNQANNGQYASDSTWAYSNIVPGTYQPFVPINGSLFLHLPANTGIYLKAENQSSAAGNATAPDGSGDFFAVSYAVPGTVTPAVTELNVLRARQYITSASSTLTIAGSATTKVDYNYEDSDIAGELSGGTFTAAVAMTVKVSAQLSFTSAVGACSLVARKNGTTDTTIATLGGGTLLSGTSTGIVLAAGNTLEVYIINGTGSSLPVYAPASGGFTPSTGYPHCDFIQTA